MTTATIQRYRWYCCASPRGCCPAHAWCHAGGLPAAVTPAPLLPLLQYKQWIVYSLCLRDYGTRHRFMGDWPASPPACLPLLARACLPALALSLIHI